jgi:hypothetical protein
VTSDDHNGLLKVLVVTLTINSAAFPNVSRLDVHANFFHYFLVFLSGVSLRAAAAAFFSAAVA